jgi:hypothetical protein
VIPPSFHVALLADKDKQPNACDIGLSSLVGASRNLGSSIEEHKQPGTCDPLNFLVGTEPFGWLLAGCDYSMNAKAAQGEVDLDFTGVARPTLA